MLAPVLAVCWTTFVIFLASPQETSLWLHILQSLSLYQVFLSSRIAWAFSCGVADLQELKQKLQGLLGSEFGSLRHPFSGIQLIIGNPQIVPDSRREEIDSFLHGRSSKHVQTWEESWAIISVDNLQQTLWFGPLEMAALCHADM